MPSNRTMYNDSGRLVVAIQQELDEDGLRQLRADVLHSVSQAGLSGIVIDLSGVSVLDSHMARELFDTGKMATLMGARAAISGINAGMAMALVDLGFVQGELETFSSVEEALLRIREEEEIAEAPAKTEQPDSGDSTHDEPVADPIGA